MFTRVNRVPFEFGQVVWIRNFDSVTHFNQEFLRDLPISADGITNKTDNDEDDPGNREGSAN